MLVLLCGIIGTAAFFLLPDLAKDLQAYDLLKSYLEKPELTMELSVDAQVGEENLDFTALVEQPSWMGTGSPPSRRRAGSYSIRKMPSFWKTGTPMVWTALSRIIPGC